MKRPQTFTAAALMDTKPKTNADYFLVNLLADGPVSATRVHAAAQDAGIGIKALRNARTRMDVVVRQAPGRTGRRGSPGWEWSLP